MLAKFAKALAENITTIAGNVAHVALIDAGALAGEGHPPPSRSDACRKIESCKRNIASILQQPGAWMTEEPAPATGRKPDLERIIADLLPFAQDPAVTHHGGTADKWHPTQYQVGREEAIAAARAALHL